MAGGTQTFGTSNAYITGRMRWSSTSNGAVANSSNVTVYLDYAKSTSSTSSTYGTFSGGININGNVKAVNPGKITLPANNVWVNVGVHTVTVPHNSDGSKSCYIGVSGGIAGTSFSSSSGEWSVALDKIPRYANITNWKCLNVELDKATFAWSTDIPINWLRTYLDNSTQHTDIFTGTASSGEFEYNGMNPSDAGRPELSTLKPATTYNLKIQVRRPDSGLWSTSGNNVTFTTLPIATITNESVGFNIGEDLVLNFKDYENNKSYLAMDIQMPDETWQNDIVAVDEVLSQESYTWGLSSLTSLLYRYTTTRRNVPIRVRCGTTINNVTHENVKLGNMVLEGGTPIFDNFLYGDIATITQDILANTDYMFQGHGNMRVTIPIEMKAEAQNQATIVSYTATITNAADTVITSVVVPETETEIQIDLGMLVNAGVFSLNVFATDSRDDNTPIVSKDIYNLPYTPPRNTIAMERHNGFEKECVINLSSVCAKLLVDDAIKNDEIVVRYRYQEIGKEWNSYRILNGVNVISISDTEQEASYVKDDAEDPFIVIPNTVGYNFQFIVSDRVSSATTIVTVSEGIPVMYEGDHGRVSVGRIPDWDSEANFQVATDILAVDEEGNDVLVLENDKRIEEKHDSLIEDLRSQSELVKSLYLLMHPVGDIIMSTNATNPGDIWGGTWVAWGKGRVPVGIDTTDPDFNTLEKTGGTKASAVVAQIGAFDGNPSKIGYAATTRGTSAFTYGGVWNSTTQNIPNSSVNHGTLLYDPANNSHAPSKLQPYVTCYMWKRTK